MEKKAFESIYQEIFPFWKEISEKDRDYICQNSHAVTYSKGETIHDGNECSGVILVRSAQSWQSGNQRFLSVLQCECSLIGDVFWQRRIVNESVFCRSIGFFRDIIKLDCISVV